MIKSMVEFLFGPFWGAFTLAIVCCIVGSIVAALRVVRHESDSEREEVKGIFAFGLESALDDRVIKKGVIVMTSPENRCRL